MAKLLQPDTLKIDPGEPGSIETTFVRNKVPSITVEMGQAKIWNNSLIDRTVDFVNRVMVDLKLTPSNTTVEPTLAMFTLPTHSTTHFRNMVVSSRDWFRLTSRSSRASQSRTSGIHLATLSRPWSRQLMDACSKARVILALSLVVLWVRSLTTQLTLSVLMDVFCQDLLGDELKARTIQRRTASLLESKVLPELPMQL